MEKEKITKLTHLKRKLESGNLTQEEMEKLLELITEKNNESKNEWQNLNNKKFLLSLGKFSCLIKGKSYKGTTEFFENLKVIITDGKSNCEEVVKGIHITSNFMSEVNLKKLAEQNNETETYEKKYIAYVREGQNQIVGADQSLPVAPKILDHLEESKQKIKKLTTEYVNN